MVDTSTALAAALEAAGLSWDGLRHAASGIILFGSRAMGLSTETSDWDLLCIGPRGPKPPGSIDLVWVDPDYLSSAHWLGSELATHVAAFGQPLAGSHAWMSSTFVSPQAAARKARRVIGKLQGIEIAWPVLGLVQRTRQARWLRLELQRLERLHRGSPVPPTAMLDQEWERLEAREEWRDDLARQLDVEPQRLASLLPRALVEPR